MNKNVVSIVFYLTAVIDFVVAMVNFSSNKASMGIVYLLLAIAFIALGRRYRKKENAAENKKDNKTLKTKNKNK